MFRCEECRRMLASTTDWFRHQVLDHMVPHPDQEAASNSPSEAATGL